MGSRASIVTVMLVCLVLAGCASGTPSGSTGSATTGGVQDRAATAALIQSQCTKCHDIQRVESAKHDEAGWRATIARMQGKGAQVTAAQVTAIATFLANGGGSALQ